MATRRPLSSSHSSSRSRKFRGRTTMTLQSLDIVRRSATTTPSPQIRQTPAGGGVAKLIDTTKCIGCKACQVACMEWNDLRDEIGTNIGQYQNPHDLSASSWTLMRFAEVENSKGDLEWLIRKDGCMHCTDPGCLKACPSPGAIVQYANGIVDFHEENCIGCGYCITGCPFDIPRISKKDKKAYKCTLCSDRVGAGLRQSLPDRGHRVRQQGGHEATCRGAHRRSEIARLRAGRSI